MKEYYQLSLEEIQKDLHTDYVKGLSEVEAEKRLEKYGYNEIEEVKGVSALKIFLSQFKSFLILILFVALGISLFLKEYIDVLVIGVVVILNGVLGFIQEYRAEKSIEALKKMESLQSEV